MLLPLGREYFGRKSGLAPGNALQFANLYYDTAKRTDRFLEDEDPGSRSRPGPWREPRSDFASILFNKNSAITRPCDSHGIETAARITRRSRYSDTNISKAVCLLVRILQAFRYFPRSRNRAYECANNRNRTWRSCFKSLPESFSVRL